MMRVLVTGVKGQLGYDVVKELESRSVSAVGVDVEEMDITDAAAVRSVITAADVDAVIHCAAYTDVEGAEDKEAICRKVNVEGTRNIAEVCRTLDIKMMYISTDYVFNGQGDKPWDPEDKREPLSVYGKTKYEGELAVQELLEKYFIVRTSWVFGVNGKNFVKTMLNLGKTRGAVSVVNDQFSSPTYTYDLAVLLADMIMTEKYGVYHASNEGYCSWYDFAVEIFQAAAMDVAVTPVDSSAFPVKVERPKNSRLDKSKLQLCGFNPLPHWKDATRRYVKEII